MMPLITNSYFEYILNNVFQSWIRYNKYVLGTNMYVCFCVCVCVCVCVYVCACLCGLWRHKFV